jgi:cytochrome P450
VDAVVAEGMRIRPVLPFTGRMVVKPFDLDGLRLEPGVMLVRFIALMHRRADLYPEPAAFRPDRFVGTKPGTYTWIPFGGGIRRCLGGPFAMLAMRVVLRTMLEELQLMPTREPDEPLARRHVTLVPGRGAMVTFERRAA